MADAMRLVLKRPADDWPGVTPTQGTILYTPDGSKVTGIVSISVDIGLNEIVKTTVVLTCVKIEYEPE